ncbi:MAG TPA: hypothetical protein VF013_09190 [Candidatus Limnocylindria bacterium]
MSGRTGMLRLASDEVELEVLPDAGARIHRFCAFGHDLLRTPRDQATHQADPFFWGAYVMAPWANRIAAAPTPLGGFVVDVPANFPDGSAIHGEVLARPWEVVAPGRLRVAGGGGGWPWRYEVDEELALAGDTLRIRLRLTNRSEVPMPAGLGIHPWFRRPLLVAVPAASTYASNLEPLARPVAVAGPLDRREPGQLPEGTDATWTDLAPGPVRLAWPELGVRAELRPGRTGTHVVAAAPSVPEATAVEVQTHAPDGLGRLVRGEPGALALLDPGDALVLDVTVRVARD